MEFIETSLFTAEISKLLSHEEYRAFQIALTLRPEQGDVIPGTSGLRKVRWSTKGQGKRGGCRIIYYWEKHSDRVFLLFPYAKNKQLDLSPAQAKVLSNLVRKELK